MFTGADLSWIEARQFNELAIGALEAQASTDSGAAALAQKIKSQLPALRPKPAAAIIGTADGMTKATSLTELLHCDGIEIGFDGKSAAISHLRLSTGMGPASADGQAQPPWAEAATGALLMDVRYVTYNDRPGHNLTCKTNATQQCPNPVPGAWSPTFVALCLPTYLPVYPPTHLPTYLSTYLPTYLPTCLPTYQSVYIATESHD